MVYCTRMRSPKRVSRGEGCGFLSHAGLTSVAVSTPRQGCPSRYEHKKGAEQSKRCDLARSNFGSPEALGELGVPP